MKNENDKSFEAIRKDMKMLYQMVKQTQDEN